MKRNYLILGLLVFLFTFSTARSEISGGLNLIQGGLGITTVSPGAIVVGSGTLRVTSTTSPTVGWITATSSRASFFPYASTTVASADTFCLTADTCRTTWPTGVAFNFTPAIYGAQAVNSTSTGLWFTSAATP